MAGQPGGRILQWGIDQMDNRELKIGVVVAVYNTEKWLDKCIESLVNQTKRFSEIVLVDDGSTDGSLMICEKFQGIYPEIKVFHQPNGKQGKARNNGLSHISSEYLLFVDSDDLLERNAVEILSNILSKKRYDAVYFEAYVFGQEEFMRTYNFKSDEYNRQLSIGIIEGTGGDFFSQCYPRSYFSSSCMAVYRTDLIKSASIFFPEGVFYEDNYFTFVFMQEAGLVCCIPDILYGRRIREESTMTSSVTAEKVRDLCDVVLLTYQYIHLRKDEIEDVAGAVAQYICDLCYFAWGKYAQYRENTGESDYVSFEKVKLVLKSYFQLSKELNDDFEQWSLSCTVTEQRTLLLVEKTDKDYLKNDAETMLRKKETYQFMRKQYHTLLKKLPLDDDRLKIGIYGIGGHTEGLLRAYSSLIGNIQADLCFFESNIMTDEQKENHGYPVKSYLEIDETYTLIIISSYIYQQEMKNNVLSVNKNCKLLCFYNEVLRRDVFSGIDSLL